MSRFPSSTLASDLAEGAEALHRLTAVIRAVRMSEPNLFAQAFDVLRQIAENLGAPIAIVGGVAGIHHGARIATAEIDISVGEDQLDAIVVEGQRQGLLLDRRSPQGWHCFRYTAQEQEVEIRVVPAGRKGPRDAAYAPANPTPQELGVERGLGYAAFAPWAVMKLVVNRDKDRAWLIDVLQHVTEQQIDDVVVKLRSLDPSYLVEWQRLVRAAEDEKQQENW